MAKGQFLGEFEQIVLLAVHRLGPDAYGVSVQQEIEDRTGREVSIGAVYATTGRLVEKGLLAARNSEPEPIRGGRSKRLFEVTPAGSEALEATWQMLQHMREGVQLGRGRA